MKKKKPKPNNASICENDLTVSFGFEKEAHVRKKKRKGEKKKRGGEGKMNQPLW